MISLGWRKLTPFLIVSFFVAVDIASLEILPSTPVSYITRMDRFIFLSTRMVFVALLHAAYSAVLVKRGKTTLTEKIDCWSRIAFPAVLLIVLTVSFVL